MEVDVIVFHREYFLETITKAPFYFIMPVKEKRLSSPLVDP